jgi:hypothetical protein
LFSLSNIRRRLVRQRPEPAAGFPKQTEPENTKNHLHPAKAGDFCGIRLSTAQNRKNPEYSGRKIQNPKARNQVPVTIRIDDLAYIMKAPAASGKNTATRST